jgi:hypothetical protein
LRGTEKSPLVVNIERTSEDRAEAEEARKDRQQNAATERWLVIFNGFLMVATIFLVVATALLYRATDKIANATVDAANAAKASADAVVSQLRAYVHVSLTEPPRITDLGVLTLIVGAKNTGQTPAYRATIVSNVGIITWPPPRPLEQIFRDFDPPDSTMVSIPAGEIIAVIPEMPDVTDEEEHLIKSGNARVVVWGRVDYDDTFKNRRTTKYALSVRWEGSGFAAPFYERVGNVST